MGLIIDLQVVSSVHILLIKNLTEHSSYTCQEKLENEKEKYQTIHLFFHGRFLDLSLLTMILFDLGLRTSVYDNTIDPLCDLER